MRLPYLGWMRSRTTIFTVVILTNLAVAGAGVYFWRQAKKLRDLANISSVVIPSSAITGVREKLAPLDVGAKTTYDQVESFTRQAYRTALDIDWREWKPTEKRFKKPNTPWEFNPNEMAAPDKEELARIVERTPVVRTMPYPYYSALTVPSDCCATTYADPYYMHTLASRKHGLDLPSSFFPYASYTNEASFGQVLALFPGSSNEPVRYLISVENEKIDAFPLLLTYFHRGWLDHIHDWSAGAASPLSLVRSVRAAVDGKGSGEAEITGLKRIVTSWCGLELQIETTPGVEAFELDLVDLAGIHHWIVHKKELGDRAGWDLSALTREELACCYVFLAKEQNVPAVSSFGKSQTGPIQSGTIRIFGTSGATVEVQSIAAVDISRAMVEGHIQLMKHFNLLPLAATYHGGNSRWATLLAPAEPYDFNDPLLEKTVRIKETPLAQLRGRPTYIADCLHDFGIIHLNRTAFFPPSRPGMASAIKAEQYENGPLFYVSERYCIANKTDKGPRQACLTGFFAHAENLGPLCGDSVLGSNKFGEARILYTHFNFYNREAFDPPSEQPLHLHQMKQLEPMSEATFAHLANLAYNLDGRRPSHQRLWVTSFSCLLRFAQAQRQLAKNVVVKDDVVRVTPWTDEVTQKPFPDPNFVTQDLHGQTFYVAKSRTARVFVAGKEIHALQRNAADFTGRESVTIVDTHCPTVVLDEVDFFETNGRLHGQGASYYFQQGNASSGQFAGEVQLEQDGKGMICWKPYLLNNHETGYVRFAYKKTNPQSRVILGWSQDGEAPQFLATDGDRSGVQGWELPCFEDTDYHEVVLSYADMMAPAGNQTKTLPRGQVKNVYLGVVGKGGDSIFFDKVEFLSARGVRPHSGNGLLVGGRIHPPRDGDTVRLNLGGKVREAITDRGGWYFFHDVPVGSVGEITYERAGVTFWPARGRLTQIEKNDVEYHVFALDPRSPSIPRPEFGEQKVPQAMAMQITGDADKPYGNFYQPHSRRFYAGNVGATMAYVVEDWVNNRGWFDKDRREENPDGSLRIFLHGACMEEGAQTPVRDHLNVIVESMLRRRTGVNIEVAVASHSNSSIAANSYLYEKYGRTLKPDFVVLMNEPTYMWHLEPTLLEMHIGWPKGHTPYRGFDFDDNGRLVEYPPDPGYPVFAKKPNPKPLVENIPIGRTYFLLSEYPPLVERSFQLFQAIAQERYVKDLEKRGGRLVVVSGYLGSDYPDQAQPEGTGVHQMSSQKFLREMRRVTESSGGLFLDLSSQVLKYDYREVVSFTPADGHLSPSGHYVIARALADRLLALPEFQEAVQRKKLALKQVERK